MNVLSIRENPELMVQGISYIQQSWSNVRPIIYEDCIRHSVTSRNPLPQWYLLEKDEEFIGCAGLITNDFISRGDLYPWLCALYIDERHRGHAYGSLLMAKAEKDTRKGGFDYLNLSTDHVGYYEKYGFEYIGQGYHPWDAESRIYQKAVR